MHYTDAVRKVLGVRAQAITRIRTNCPSINLMLKKENKCPSLQLSGRGQRLPTACLSVDPQDLRALEKNGIWLVGEQE